MKVLVGWLRELAPTELDATELAEQFTMHGLKVESLERTARAYDRMVAGTVLELGPLDDRLRLCRVAVGGEPVGIVTAASNVRPGMRVGVALPGATLAGGAPVAARSFGGVESQGVLLSLAELGLAPAGTADGIHELAGEPAPGRPLAEVLPLDDVLLEIEVTHNRGDCLSVLGLAREAAALGAGRVELPPCEVAEAGPPAETKARVRVENAGACPRYVGRVIEELAVGPSPLWLAARLHLSGARPINNVVDVTNYVLLELGQPLHPFDLDRVPDGLVVVRDAPGERVVTLDGVERDLPPGTLAICDRERPIAIAGVMGGLDTQVTPTTRRVLLEAAHFDAVSVRRTSKALGLSTEASYRFERGIDGAGVSRAARRTARLLAELAGGRVAAGELAVGRSAPEARELALRPARVSGLLGKEIAPAEIARTLGRLGMPVAGGEPLRVKVPSHRNDIREEIDLIEEVARIHGYDRLPSTSGVGRTVPRHLTPRARLVDRSRSFFVGRGFHEAVTMSLLEERVVRAWLAAAGREAEEPLRLLNPVSEALGCLRPALLPGLLGSLVVNVNRQRRDPRLFEQAIVFHPQPGAERPRERWHLAAVWAGSAEPPAWDRPERAADFHDLRGLLESYFACLGLTPPELRPSSLAIFRGGLGAEIVRQGEPLGLLGELGLAFRNEWGVRREALVMELELEPLAAECAESDRRYRGLPRYPAVERDVAVVVDAAVSHERVARLFREEAGALLEELRLFDCYQGEPLDAGQKSLAFSLTLRATDRTLTEEEAQAVRSRIAERAARELGARLRE